jgi:hypothetical protein
MVSSTLLLAIRRMVQLRRNSGELAKVYGPMKDGKKTIPSLYQTFDGLGNIYSLFYERGCQLLKEHAHLCYITSNKWMRSGYGENIRKFFADYTNPKLLIDFSGHKVFESATVDVNILLFSKDKNKNETKACIINKKESVNNLSTFVLKNGFVCKFGTESWVVLSSIEQCIKAKVESIGVPLKNWDIDINLGIVTGFNEAFIIDGKKKAELIKQDPKNEEIIKPILRGKDIERYGYEFADLYLISTLPSMKININKYPAVKKHLLSFGHDRLDPTGNPGARKKTNNKWFETQDNVAYWEKFLQPKIIYANMRIDPSFMLDNGTYFANQKCYILTGPCLDYLVSFFNSKLFKFCFWNNFPTLGENTRELTKMFIEKIPVLQIDKKTNKIFKEKVTEIQKLKQKNLPTEDLEKEIDNLMYELYGLTEEEIEFIEGR